jgi:hypothetical protein
LLERATIINKDEEGEKGGKYNKSLKGMFSHLLGDFWGTHSIATFHQLKVSKCMMSLSFTSKPIISYHVARVKKVIVLLKVIGAKNGNNILQQQQQQKLGIGLITQTSPSQLINYMAM